MTKMDVAVGQCKRHLLNSIYYLKFCHYYSGTIKHNRWFRNFNIYCTATTGQQI